MKYNIIGWYGTETLGDIAILDGIIKVILSIDLKASFMIGSLNPFYTERTFLYNNLKEQNNKTIEICIYDIKNKSQRVSSIGESSMILVGGGPLMGIHELKILRNTFREAKKIGIPRIILGCGITPIYSKEFNKVLKELLYYSTAITYRDVFSLKESERLFPNLHAENLGDPAIISIEDFKRCNTNSNQIMNKPYVAVNLRDYRASEYSSADGLRRIDIRKTIEKIACDYEVKLIPMHTFYIGGDDREYYCKIMGCEYSSNVEILHTPLSLAELYNYYNNAFACIGMRYHSVVIQTILNGNNIILDYTNKGGKIDGFLKEYDINGFYNNRRLDLHQKFNDDDVDQLIKELEKEEKFKYKSKNILKKYSNFLIDVMNSCT